MTDNVTQIFVTEPSTDPQPIGTAYIILAGKNWPIPKLAIRQWRVVVPAVFKLMGTFGPMFDKIRAGEASTAVQHASLTVEQMDGLVDTVHAALTRAHPRITRDTVLDLETSVTEMMEALPIIMKQAGLFSPAPAPTRTAATPGEARTESPTGMG